MRYLFLIIFSFSILVVEATNDIGEEYLKGKTALKENNIKEAKQSFLRCFEIIDSCKTFVKRINCHSVEYSYGELNPEILDKLYFWMAFCYKRENKPLLVSVMMEFAEVYRDDFEWKGKDGDKYQTESKKIKQWIKKAGGELHYGIEFLEGSEVMC